jgi:hypothetical protein
MGKPKKYKFLTEDSTDITQTCPIEILEGKYEGIIYRYGKISFNELESGELSINMDIQMIAPPSGFDQQETEFTTTVGDIFVDIVENNITLNESSDLEADVHEDPLDKP